MERFKLFVVPALAGSVRFRLKAVLQTKFPIARRACIFRLSAKSGDVQLAPYYSSI